MTRISPVNCGSPSHIQKFLFCMWRRYKKHRDKDKDIEALRILNFNCTKFKDIVKFKHIVWE